MMTMKSFFTSQLGFDEPQYLRFLQQSLVSNSGLLHQLVQQGLADEEKLVEMLSRAWGLPRLNIDEIEGVCFPWKGFQ